MATQPSDAEIEKLLADLRSHDPSRRFAATEEIRRSQLRHRKIIRQLKINASTDASDFARQGAQYALGSLGIRQGDKLLSPNFGLFVIGFAGWFIVNGVLVALASWLSVNGAARAQTVGSWLPTLVFLANIVALIVLAAFQRGRWVAFGALSAVASILCLVLVFGALLAAACYTSRPA